MAGEAWLGRAWRRWAWFGRRGKALFGLEGTGEDWRGMAGMARLGIAW